MSESAWTCVRLSLVALLLLGCHDRVSFDEQEPDASSTTDAQGTDGPPCSAMSCGWRRRDDCASQPCGIECPEGKTCGGTCGDQCRSTCELRSDCMLVAGMNANLLCESASCALEVGNLGSIFCAGDAHCTLRCQGSCSITCSAISHCTLQCAGDAAPQIVTGAAGCS